MNRGLVLALVAIVVVVAALVVGINATPAVALGALAIDVALT